MNIKYIENKCSKDGVSIFLLPLEYNGTVYNTNYQMIFPEFETFYKQQYLVNKHNVPNPCIQRGYTTTDQRHGVFFLIDVLNAEERNTVYAMEYPRLYSYLFDIIIPRYKDTIYIPIPFWKDICHIEHLEMYLIDHEVNALLIDNKGID